MTRICISSKCGWVGEEADCLDYKHPIGARLCPECYEVTEEIHPEPAPADAWRCPECDGINAGDVPVCECGYSISRRASGH